MNSQRAFGSVEEYVRNAAPEARGKLLQMRAVFRRVAPQADEKISYNMPYYYHNGPLGGFAAYKDHVTLFGAFPDELKDNLRSYKTGRGSVQFPLDDPLPVPLIIKLVRAHLAANRARGAEGGKR